MPERPSAGLHRFAVLTAAAAFLLLFVGGLVTSTGSGLAGPDWPLSLGQGFPPTGGGGLWVVVGEPRPGVRALALTALVAVVLQGVLGGVTVLYKLPLAVSVTHACLAEVSSSLTATRAIESGRAWMGPRAGARAVAPGLAVLAAATTGLVFTQIALGALVRHMGAGLAIPD